MEPVRVRARYPHRHAHSRTDAGFVQDARDVGSLFAQRERLLEGWSAAHGLAAGGRTRGSAPSDVDRTGRCDEAIYGLALSVNLRFGTMTSAPETLEFQAETKALLRLVTLTRSMQTRDIFLRELISNASRRVGSATG